MTEISDADIELTVQLLHAGATNWHGFTNRQLEILGVERRRGWLHGLVGRKISAAQFQAFLDANPARGSKRRRSRRRDMGDQEMGERSCPVLATPFRDLPPDDGTVPWE